MSRLRRTVRVAASAVAVATVVTVGLPAGTAQRPAATAQTLDDLDAANDVVHGLRSELGEVNAEFERVWAEIEHTQREIETLRDEADRREADVEAATQMLGERARTAFKYGATSTMQTLLTSEGSQATVERAGLLAALQVREQVGIEEAVATQRSLDQTVGLIAQREAELVALQAELEGVAASLQGELETAQDEAATIASLVARQRRIDRGAQSGIDSCIFDVGVSTFRDTFGAPRSGGRSHKGTDVFAVHGAPVYAITSGVIERHSNGGLGGLGLYLRGDDQNLYYYAHLDRIDGRGQVGNRVTAGELVARNGSSGNADAWAPHVHFELRPGGGGSINPYPWLAAACF